jgi:hypothetical protein
MIIFAENLIIMAKYKITYKFGHTAEVQLFGKISDREKKIEWYSTIDCPNCKSKEASELNGSDGLPKLEGSEKQISWALEIRHRAASNSDVKEMIEKIESLTPEQQEQLRQQIDNAPTYVVKYALAMNYITSSKWWIENR